MKYFLFSIIALAATSATALPEIIQQRMSYMCQTSEPFVQQAIMNELRAQHPSYDNEIVSNWPAICQTLNPQVISQKNNVVPTQQTSLTEESATSSLLNSNAIPSLYDFSGSIDAAVNIQTGNTEQTEYSLGAKGEQELEDWRHQFEAAAYNSKENDQRTSEEYRFGIGTNWKINEQDYLYADAKYVDDRYSGFDYRISESVGYGRRWIDDEIYLLDTRIGPGFRHTKFNDGDKEDDWIIKFGLLAGWVPNSYIEFGEDLTVEYSPDSTVILSQTFAKSKISESLALKVGFDVEHVTEVPAGNEKTDTRTGIGLSYDY